MSQVRRFCGLGQSAAEEPHSTLQYRVPVPSITASLGVAEIGNGVYVIARGRKYDTGKPIRGCQINIKAF